MAFKSSKNVWGKTTDTNKGFSFGNDGTKPSLRLRPFGSSQVTTTQGNSAGGCLALGPFGTSAPFGSSSGTTSLPTFAFGKEKSKLYHFEIGSASSGSSCSSSTTGSGSNSLLTFGMEPKNYRWDSNTFLKSDEAKMEVSSGGSSRNSSNHGSNNRLDWGGMVESVFKEEIGNMAEGLQRGTGFGRNLTFV